MLIKILWREMTTYLEVILEPKAALSFVIPAGREVIAKLAGGVCAVAHELGADCVIHISSGISYNAGAW